MKSTPVFRPLISCAKRTALPAAALIFASYMLPSLITPAASAQEMNPMAQAPKPEDNQVTQQNGVYIYRVKVVQRDLDAVNYLHRSGSTTIGFEGTPLLPRAKGEA